MDADLQSLLDTIRNENATAQAETRGELKTVAAELSHELKTVAAELSHEFKIVAEGLRHEIQTVAEGVVMNGEKIDRLDAKVERLYSDLDFRVTRVEAALSRPR
jgi:hypothetical protein